MIFCCAYILNGQRESAGRKTCGSPFCAAGKWGTKTVGLFNTCLLAARACFQGFFFKVVRYVDRPIIHKRTLANLATGQRHKLKFFQTLPYIGELQQPMV